MTAVKTVLLRHPETKGEWACPAAAVESWLAKGWVRADTKDVMADAVAPMPANTRKDK